MRVVDRLHCLCRFPMYILFILNLSACPFLTLWVMIVWVSTKPLSHKSHVVSRHNCSIIPAHQYSEDGKLASLSPGTKEKPIQKTSVTHKPASLSHSHNAIISWTEWWRGSAPESEAPNQLHPRKQIRGCCFSFKGTGRMRGRPFPLLCTAGTSHLQWLNGQ